MGTHVGVDIGTSSIRVTYNSTTTTTTTKSQPIRINKSKFITQSSLEIYESLLQLLPPHHSSFDSIAISATCSTVITKKINGFLHPFNLDPKGTASDVLLWMDNSAIQETQVLNSLDTPEISHARAQLGGNFISELGLPKLKMIQNTYPEEVHNLVCFELYDWISYMLKYGVVDGRVECHSLDIVESHSYATDGSIKGWSKNLLKEAGISLEIGGVNSINGSIGEPIGMVHGTNAVIGHGCIDCYAGWINSLSSQSQEDSNSCFMVAGTSTCFIYNSKQKSFHDGMWGPYNLTKPGHYVYEFGQPATGKLYERLFTKHGISPNNYASTFATLEKQTAEVEKSSCPGIHQLLKGYFYYGDVYGNRTPYQDGAMSESIIDNPNGPFGPIINNNNTTTADALLAEYNLIMEFLAFQTRHLIEPLGVDTLVISGSQAKNARFVQLVADLCDVEVRVMSVDCCVGAAKLGHVAQLCHEGWTYENAFDNVTRGDCSQEEEKEKEKEVVFTPRGGGSKGSAISESELSLLLVKYQIYLDMADRQRQYRDMMG
ncbi:MPA43 [Candida metapsilosis]|uniref:MPA43 n=1 Tax=Candida metapsilosis TaxID=273372 RepID=A0A8H7ZEV1_9ASCO|nr:MPA43 [Candida metapsilosis]